VRLISPKALRGFAVKHPDSSVPLGSWRKIMEAARFTNFIDLKKLLPSADSVKVGTQSLYVFNIAGNKYRLIAAIHFKSQIVFIRHILTHAEYDKDEWKS
jgi:mRNA interferase HigB